MTATTQYKRLCFTWLQIVNLIISHRNHLIYSLQTIAAILVVQIEHFDDDGSSECESTSNNWPERYFLGSLVKHQYVYITYVLCSGSILGHRSFYRTPNADNFLPGKIRERHPSSSQTNPEWRPEIEKKGWSERHRYTVMWINCDLQLF